MIKKLLVANTPALACIIASIYLAANSLDGWGWFLFAGVIVTQTVKTNKEHEND